MDDNISEELLCQILPKIDATDIKRIERKVDYSYQFSDAFEAKMGKLITHKGGRNAYVKRIFLAVACVMIIMAGIGTVFHSSHRAVLKITVYAKDPNDESICIKNIGIEETAPASLFKVKNTPVFVISYETEQKDTPARVCYVIEQTSQLVTTNDIPDLDIRRGNVYVVFLPKEEKECYEFSFCTFAGDLDKIYDILLSITRSENDYIAKIESIETRDDSQYKNKERTNTESESDSPLSETPDIEQLVKPYLDVLDRIGTDYEFDLNVPDDKLEIFYNSYREMSLEEFEIEIRKELEALDGNE